MNSISKKTIVADGKPMITIEPTSPTSPTDRASLHPMSSRSRKFRKSILSSSPTKVNNNTGLDVRDLIYQHVTHLHEKEKVPRKPAAVKKEPEVEAK